MFFASVLGAEVPVLQLPPIDETDLSESFRGFRAELTDAVSRRDLDFVLDHLKPDIHVSFGGRYGREGFVEFWKLSDRPGDSKLWGRLEDLLELGATCENDSCSIFIIPYLFRRYPKEYDPYFYSAIISERALLREEPHHLGTVLDTLSYAIVKNVHRPAVRDSAGTEWQMIETLGGTPGFVLKAEHRSPIDLRAQFEYENGKWQIGFLLAGD